MEIDLLNVDPALEATQHKLKRQVQSPDSFFMDVKCPMCHTVTTVYSNPQRIVVCRNCKHILCVPKGGKGKLCVGSAWRRKGN